MSSAIIKGATFAFSFFRLCTNSVIAFLSHYEVDSYPKYSRHQLYYSEPDEMNPIIATSPPQHHIFSQEIYERKRNDIEAESLYKDRIEELPYSLASKLVCLYFILYFEQSYAVIAHTSCLSCNPSYIINLQHVTHVPLAEEDYAYPIAVIGHRGSPYTALENTSRSFIHAAQAGADGVELDIFLLKCGSLVVFHGSSGDENPGLLHSYCGIKGSM